MTPFIAKLVWVAGIIGWYVIRYPHQRRSRKTPIASRRERAREGILLATSFTGLFILPLIYVTTGEPRVADYPFHPLLAGLGAATVTVALLGFYRTPRHLPPFSSLT